MAEKSRVTTPCGRHESLVPGVSSSRLRPDSDQSRIWCRARPWLVCDSLKWAHLHLVPGSALWYTDIWQSFFFFFFFCRFVSLTRRWQSTECDTRYMVQRKKFDVILRFLVDRYRQTKPPKPDASQFVVPARLPKPAIGSGGLSSSRFDALGEMQRHVYIRIPVRALINLTGKGVKSMEIERRHPESVRSRAEIWKLQHQRKVEERRK